MACRIYASGGDPQTLENPNDHFPEQRGQLPSFGDFARIHRCVSGDPQNDTGRQRYRPPCRQPVSVVVKPPEVLSLDACKKLLEAAQAHKGGLLAPYVAVCLFGGLRPFEAARLTWDQVNLQDREIRMEASQTKTKRPRVVLIDETLRAWLVAHKDKPFFPTNWRKEFDAVRAAAQITRWPNDIMRHTAISHYFRRVGSYGQTAEWAGNSEAIIKAHYQGRVSTKEAKKFWAMRPGKGGKS